MANRRAKRWVVSVAIASALALFSGCSEAPTKPTSSDRPAQNSPTAASSAPSAASEAPDPVGRRVLRLTRDTTPIRIRAAGSVALRGLRYGNGPRAVLLSHMGRAGDSQEDWAPLAARLAATGLTVVTYDRRGVCSPHVGTCSTGGGTAESSWRDVVAAVEHLRGMGFESVVVGGASLGAMDVLEAVRRRDLDVDGLIWFAGVLSGDYTFARGDFANLPSVPKLFISTRDDGYGAGTDTRQAYRWSSPPHQLVLLPGDLHGTDLVDAYRDDDQTAVGNRRRVIDAFLGFTAPPQ